MFPSPFLHRGTQHRTKRHGRELNALLQRLSADLEDAKSAGESNSKRADATAKEIGLREEEGRRIKEALAATESKLAAEQRYRKRISICGPGSWPREQPKPMLAFGCAALHVHLMVVR